MTDLDPTRSFSGKPGADGTLIPRREIRGWLERIAQATARLRLRTIGTSTEGRPIDAVFIAADLSGDRLDALLEHRLAAIPSLLNGRADPGWRTPIVLVTSGIHATEVGGPQSIPELIHWLVFDESAAAEAIRERVLTIVVPSLNPDGMDLVQRWHDATAGTSRAGSLPPLLYHRHAGHDNNRDWLFRNLPETRVALDTLHRPWLPHVTLDQHQMNPQGPRFALPPYADPWEPNIPPVIVAAANGLGQDIATEMTLAGMSGVTTGRYFDAWEPSRAIQHFRGGVRILAEAASANLASPIEITPDQLTAPPLPLELTPTTAAARPWTGGSWRLRDIIDYHLAAARSLLSRVAADPERWLRVQGEALGERLAQPIPFSIPLGRPACDVAANRRLAELLDAADLLGERADTGVAVAATGTALDRLSAALLVPKAFPERHGPSSYDVTTHHLPLFTGAAIATGARRAPAPRDRGDGRWLVIDARSHRAPELAEIARRTGPDRALRASALTMSGPTLIEPGAWLIDRTAIPEELHALAHATASTLPARAVPDRRRDIVLLAASDLPSADHGWTRWWLEARHIPYLEAEPNLLPSLEAVARSTTMLIADTGPAELAAPVTAGIDLFVAAGGHVIAFGQGGRSLAGAIARGVSSTSFPAGGSIQAPGALLRLVPARSSPIAIGLDRAIPAMLQRDGVFSVKEPIPDVDVIGRFAARDTLVSGWMSEPAAVRNAPAILEIRRGAGRLHAFAFRPLFRGQMLATAPLVHNLIYASLETPSCPPHDPAKTHAKPTSARTS